MADKNYLIPVWETITAAWLKVSGTKKSVWAAIGIILLVIIAFAIVEAIVSRLSTLNSIISFIGQIIISLMQVGLLYIGIKRAFDLPFNYRLIYQVFETKRALTIIGVYILKVLILLPSLILLIIPIIVRPAESTITIIFYAIGIIGAISFIYLSARIILGMAFVLDKDANPMQAIKLSFAATKDNAWRLIGIYIIQFCIVAISLIPIGIGLIWTIPFVLILYGTVYKRLLVNVNN